jgi:hypothetical protein
MWLASTQHAQGDHDYLSEVRYRRIVDRVGDGAGESTTILLTREVPSEE